MANNKVVTADRLEYFKDKLADVAISGSYNDLSNKPTIPSKTSQLTNDSGFLTAHQDISGKQDKLIAGNNITIGADGKTISATDTKYTLPTASASTLGGIKVGTNLSISSGVLSATDTTYGNATTSASGLMSASDKTKLDGIATGANKTVVDTDLSSTSTNPVQNKAIYTELSGKASSSHTHDDRYYTESEINTKLNAKLNTSLKGAASGLAELGSDGKVPSSQLPSYVDDVLEYSSKSAFPSTGETGKIYVDLSNNKTYRWSGSAYVEISPSLALGTTSSTAFRGDYGNTAYTHSQSAHAPSNAEENQNAFSNIVVGSTTIAADSKTDTLTLVAGDNVTLTPDATNDKVTIAAADTKYTHPSSHPASMISGLATVATTGSYNDLSNKPTIPTQITVDSALSSTSTNPVQNKVINSALSGKASSSHTHTKSQITDFPTIPTKTSELTNDSGYTTNVGTITGIKMNGASKGTSGVVDLGTVLTSHQDISGKENTSNKVTAWSSTTTDAHYPSEKLVKTALDGKANSSHTHTKSQITDFPTLATVATSGSYNDLSNKPTIPSAYTHPAGNAASKPSGLYKISTDSTSHVSSVTAVTKADITDLGIPGSDTNTTYTFTNGTNGFTVTPSGGTAQTVTVTPSISNNVTGSGTSGYIAKFNGANTITNGPAFGSSTTTFLRNDGSWATPESPGGSEEISIGTTAPSTDIKLWVDTNTEYEIPTYQLPVATNNSIGGVKPDGTTVSISGDGTISSTLPSATQTVLGGIKIYVSGDTCYINTQ